MCYQYTQQPINTTDIYTQNSQHQSVSSEDALAKIDDFRNIAQKMATGKITEQEIMKLASSVDMATIGGLILGGVGAMQLVKSMENNKKEGE